MLVCAFGVVLHAQSGVVRSGNQPIPGATVKATQGDKTVVTTTGEDGYYAFPSLGGGEWTVEVQMFGFESVKQQIDYSKTGVASFNLKLRESPAAERMARFAGARGNGQAGNQLDSQIQSELNSGQAQVAPPAAPQNSNEAFLISGSLSQGLSQNAAPDSGP